MMMMNYWYINLIGEMVSKNQYNLLIILNQTNYKQNIFTLKRFWFILYNLYNN